MQDDLHSTPAQTDSGQTITYLIRHGLTDWNVEKRFQGQLEVPLNQEGVRQAEAVAVWLAAQPVQFAALYTSDLARAAHTAQAIGARLMLVPQSSAALREINCGDWQGLSVAEVESRYPGQLAQWHAQVDSYTLPGGESIPQVQRRMFAFYKGVADRHRGEATIIVSHGAALEALLAAIFGWDLADTWRTQRGRLGNTGVTALATDPHTGTPTLLMHNHTAHLEHVTGMLGGHFESSVVS